MVRFNIECPVSFPREQFWRIRDCAAFLSFIVDDGLLRSISITDPVPDTDDGNDTNGLSRDQFYSPVSVECPDFIRHLVGDTMFNVADHQRWNDHKRPYHISFEIRPTFLTDLSSTSGELSIIPFPNHKQKKHHQHNEEKTTTSQLEDVQQQEAAADSDKSTDDDTSSSSSSSSSSGDEDNNNKSDDRDMTEYIDLLPPHEKSIHRVVGSVRVRILTLGWFVERSVAHNLRLFYKAYANTIYRFRLKLYHDFANNDMSVPIEVVIDRLLQHEKDQRELMQQTRDRTSSSADDARCIRTGSQNQALEFLANDHMEKTVAVPAAR